MTPPTNQLLEPETRNHLGFPHLSSVSILSQKASSVAQPIKRITNLSTSPNSGQRTLKKESPTLCYSSRGTPDPAPALLSCPTPAPWPSHTGLSWSPAALRALALARDSAWTPLCPESSFVPLAPSSHSGLGSTVPSAGASSDHPS